MTDPKSTPTRTESARAQADRRRERQAAALRANLQRRKSQDRAREPAQTTTDPDSRPPRS
jgi:hypothetical protein